MTLDKDLQSIQEVRGMMKKAVAAQKEFQDWDQARVDALMKAIADACIANAEPLAKMAHEETGFGIWQDKVIKNLLGSKLTYEYIKDMKTVDVIREDREKRLMEIAVPVGVVAALIPSTNPTSTTMYKTLISVKAGNAIIVSPHPNAKKCILETVRIIQEAAKAAGAPDGLIQCVELTTIQATNTLMQHPDTGIILATGGTPMVKAAYSSGNPALGVGPGNGPSFIERSANIPEAVKHILDSKTFDNGTVCASEQSIVTERCIADEVRAEVKRQGGYFMTEEQSKRVEKMIMRANNTMNPAIVGKSVQAIAKMAGITVPKDARVLVSEQTEVGPGNPYSREKLCPILAFFVEDTWEKCCEKSIAILQNEGAGHTMTIHSSNTEIIRQFALKKPVSRLLVNTPGSLGGVGATTNLAPALTLGCGAVGGSATSDNVNPMNLFNLRRVAWGVRELEDIRKIAPAAAEPCGAAPASSAGNLNTADVERITREILAAMLAKK
ncbi:MAG: acetaldehyde dehydrogenase (acetylating) [Oscillibacter sp.]|jgi:acetaldehyde dehydrogenase (acetylating)|nr:acetaldehyde dehydrogenase (acetylating) [Oscillibacter sp.]